jgi:hypothetical protein
MADAEAERRSAAGDLAAGIVLLMVSAIGAWSLSANKSITAVDYGDDPGPGLVPILLIGLLALSSVAMMAMAGTKLLRLNRSGIETRLLDRTGHTLIVPVLMVVALLVYSQSMTWLGFLETTAVFSLFWTVALGLQDTRRPKPGRLVLWLLEGAAICAGIYVVFAWFIKIPLP